MIDINKFQKMSREQLDMLAWSLLRKRQHDGLNGRTWDAEEHARWENIVCKNLTSFGLNHK